jgi:hypothetical protein
VNLASATRPQWDHSSNIATDSCAAQGIQTSLW